MSTDTILNSVSIIIVAFVLMFNSWLLYKYRRDAKKFEHSSAAAFLSMTERVIDQEFRIRELESR